MREDIAMDWVADLRANADKQGKKMLRTTKGEFCCLGRLCELNGCPSRRVSSFVLGQVVKYGRHADEEHHAFLPKSVQEWGDVKGARPTLPFADRRGAIIGLDALNDRGFTFHQIADLIEAFWPWL